MKLYSFRLTPGQDLKIEIERFVKNNGIQAGFIITCVADLTQVKIRMAGAKPDKQDIRTYQGHFEVVSLVGTVSVSGCHLHISISDEEGIVTGGHLKEDSLINLTAEIVLGEDQNSIFKRELDPETGFDELTISHR